MLCSVNLRLSRSLINENKNNIYTVTYFYIKQKGIRALKKEMLIIRYTPEEGELGRYLASIASRSTWDFAKSKRETHCESKIEQKPISMHNISRSNRIEDVEAGMNFSKAVILWRYVLLTYETSYIKLRFVLRLSYVSFNWHNSGGCFMKSRLQSFDNR